MAMRVEPLSPALGAAITGVDLRQPLDATTIKAINDAFDRYIVVVFRDQELSEEDQIRAAS
jgi:alpha-ketoglutarate-dependent taurine dioxygenase